MPFEIPSFEDTRSFLIAAMSGRFPNANLNRFSDIYKRLSVVSLGITDLHYHIRQVGLDVMPDTAEGDQLDRHGVIWDTPRKGATGSARSAALRVFGDVGATVPVSEPLTHTPSGLSFETRSGGVIAATGFLDVDVAALSTGSQTNLEADQELTFDTTPVNIEDTARILFDLESGLDEEVDGSLRARVLNRIGQPAAGGNQNDWDNFVLEARDDVATSYTYPNRNGLGTVDLAALKAGSGTARLFDSGERTEIADNVETDRPITATIRVLEVTTNAVDVEVAIKPEKGPQYKFDWDDSSGFTVTTYTSGTRTLQLSANRPSDLDVGDRLVVDDPLSDGSVAVIESFGAGADEVVLVDDLGYAPTPGSAIYAGGPITETVRTAIKGLIDSLGPANPDAKQYGNWEGNLRLSTLFEVIQTSEGVLDSTIVVPVANVEADDPLYPANDSVELLIPGKLIVREDN